MTDHRTRYAFATAECKRGVAGCDGMLPPMSGEILRCGCTCHGDPKPKYETGERVAVRRSGSCYPVGLEYVVERRAYSQVLAQWAYFGAAVTAGVWERMLRRVAPALGPVTTEPGEQLAFDFEETA